MADIADVARLYRARGQQFFMDTTGNDADRAKGIERQLGQEGETTVKDVLVRIVQRVYV